MNNLTTPEGRKEALKLLHSELLEKLHSLNLGFAKDLHCMINGTDIEVGLKNDNNDVAFSFLWASSFIVYTSVNRYGKIHPEEKISVGVSGSFSPAEKAPFWRTVHTAIILQNWDVLMAIFKHFCERYEVLMVEIQTANQ